MASTLNLAISTASGLPVIQSERLLRGVLPVLLDDDNISPSLLLQSLDDFPALAKIILTTRPGCRGRAARWIPSRRETRTWRGAVRTI